MELKLFSVIIPNKNNTKLLDRCLQSIPRRDDIQIIICDDNSDPSKMDFDNYPGSKDDRAEILFSKESKGAGHARNMGLSKAVGKWVLFADSDDFYEPNAFDIFEKYADSDYDIIYFNVISRDTNSLKRSNRDRNFSNYIDLYISGKDPNAENIRFRKWEPWNKMYRRTFLDKINIKFDEIPRCNDMHFTLFSGLLATKYMAIPEKLYCITTNYSSITKTKIVKEVFWYSILCEMKKNYIYELIRRKEWQSKYVFIFLCILKNNGIKQFFEYLYMLYDRRERIKQFRQRLVEQKEFCNLKYYQG